MDPVASRLFVCYVPGLDRRRVGAERTPWIEQLLAGPAAAELAGDLGTDHLPTLLTGTRPHEHRLWQVSLRPEARIPKRAPAAARLFGAVSTALQGVRHLADRRYPLPAVPASRRRQFVVRRGAYRGAGRGTRALEILGDQPTVFGMIADARFRFTRRLAALERQAETLPSADCALEFLEVHALDALQHWNLDVPERVERAYRRTDRFLRGLDERCRERGVTLMLLADHGQELVFGAIPLMRPLEAARVAATDYTCFVEPTLARFWFHTEEARARLTQVLRAVEHARVLTLREIRDYRIEFEDDAYGELFVSPEPGWVFHPSDVHHPLLDLVRGLFDPAQRPRLLDSRPRGAHGYLPGHPSERGFVAVADPRFRALRPAAELIDVAPTLLGMLGQRPPVHMRGSAIFG